MKQLEYKKRLREKLSWRDKRLKDKKIWLTRRQDMTHRFSQHKPKPLKKQQQPLQLFISNNSLLKPLLMQQLLKQNDLETDQSSGAGLVSTLPEDSFD